MKAQQKKVAKKSFYFGSIGSLDGPLALYIQRIHSRFFLFIALVSFLFQFSTTLNAQVQPLPAFPPDYVLLDNIPAGSLGTRWVTADINPMPIRITRYETTSQYDKSRAILQKRVSYTSADAGVSVIWRNFQLDSNCTNGTKIALHSVINAISSGGRISATVSVVFFKGSTQVGSKKYGITVNGENTNDFTLANPFSGILEIEAQNILEPFNNFSISFENSCDRGWCQFVFDEIKVKQVLAETVEESLKSTQIVPDSLTIGLDGTQSGMNFRALCSAQSDVVFKIKNQNGDIFPLGTFPTNLTEGEYVAELLWKGNMGDSLAEAGSYELIAEVGTSVKTSVFSVARVYSRLLGTGDRLYGTVDPTLSILPNPGNWMKSCLPIVQAYSDRDGYPSIFNIDKQINAVSGNFVYPCVDITLKSRVPLSLSRIYNSLDSSIGLFGRGWSSPFLSHLEFMGQSIIFVNSDGSRTFFKFENGNYVCGEFCKLQLVSTVGSAAYKLTVPGEMEWKFDSTGKIISISKGVLSENSDVVFVYDLSGKLFRVSSSGGQSFTFTVNSSNLIEKAVDSTGRTFVYAYDSNKNLISSTNPMGYTTSYTYNSDNLLNSVALCDTVIKTIHYQGSRASEIVYADGSNLTCNLDSDNRILSVKDRGNAVHQLNFTPAFKIAAYSVPEAGIQKEFTYSNHAITEYKNPLGNIYKYSYNEAFMPDSITNPDGTVNRFFWDAALNKLSKKIDTLNREWNYSYDSRGNLISVVNPSGAAETFNYNQSNDLISTTDQMGNTSTYSHDSDGREVSQTDAVGNTSKFNYNSAGHLVSKITPLNEISTMTWDLMDRLTTLSDPIGNKVLFEYDCSGNLVAKTDALGRRSIYAYNSIGKRSSETDPEGRTKSYGYDSAGNCVRITDGANRTSRREYDLLGRLVSEIDPMGNKVTYTYNLDGKRTSVTNARNQTIVYQFDVMGRMVKIEYPDGNITNFVLDSEGQELSRSDMNSEVLKAYDASGNITSETITSKIYPDFVKSWKYSYDAAGKRVSAVSPDDDIFNYSYDKMNRLITLDPKGHKSDLKYFFDACGNKIKSLRSNALSSFDYDSSGRVLSILHARDEKLKHIVSSRKYVYDSCGNCVSMSNDDGDVYNYNFDASGFLSKVSFSDGKQITYLYNGAGDKISEKTEVPVVEKKGKNTVFATDTEIVSYSYDSAGRLISMNNDSFEYDQDGNLIRATESNDEKRFFWSSDNRLLKVEREIECSKHTRKHCGKCPRAFEISEEYVYLPADNRVVSRKIGNSTFLSVYDGLDESHEYLVFEPHFKRAKSSNAKFVLYREFISGPSDKDIEVSVYRGRMLNLLKDANGSTIALSNNGGNAVAKINYDFWGNFLWPENKHDNSPFHNEDELSGILASLEGKFVLGGAAHNHWHFGRHFGKILTPYLFQGERYSPLSELYYTNGRYYSPKIGRNISH
ncbi:MAG: hypothetical protein HQM10_19345 [Candidatus Riflebacteria bacterium]|nr:hypothetical protein [Candidatus Riflebacteria bacterium]